MIRRGLRWRRARQRPAGVDLTPLVDVTLMLVVFLLLAAETVDARSLPVSLPVAPSADEDLDEWPSVIVTAAGEILVEGTVQTLFELSERADSWPAVLIQADAACPHGRVVAVVDALRRGGSTTILYGVEAGDGDW